MKKQIVLYSFFLLNISAIQVVYPSLTTQPNADVTYTVKQPTILQANAQIPQLQVTKDLSTTSLFSQTKNYSWTDYIMPIGLGILATFWLYKLVFSIRHNPKTSPVKQIPSTPRGLYNNGNICYRNALLQALRPVYNELRDPISGEFNFAQSYENPILTDWQLFLQNFTNNQNTSAINLEQQFKNVHTFLLRYFPNKFAQQDSHELFLHLCDEDYKELVDQPSIITMINKKIEPFLPTKISPIKKTHSATPIHNPKISAELSTEAQKLLAHFFQHHFSVTITSSIRNLPTLEPVFESKTQEQQKNITLSFPLEEKNYTLDELFQETYQPATLMGDNQYKHDMHGKVDAQKSLTLSIDSKYLLIQLNRFADPNTPRTDPVTIPLTLTIPTKVLTDSTITKRYTLESIVHRSGTSVSSGHYFARVKNGTSWYTCNDSHIWSSNDEIDTANQTITSTNAYLLLYKETV